jgi:hypothetical protein
MSVLALETKPRKKINREVNMQDRIMASIQDVAQGLLPNVLQYPFKRLRKSFQNFSQYRKRITTATRLTSAVSTSVLAMSTVWIFPGVNTALEEFAAANFSNLVVADIAMYIGLAIAGFGIGDVVSKQILRAYRYFRYDGVTNEEYIALRVDEIMALKEIWNVDPALALDVFKYLTSEIAQNRKSAKASDSTDEAHTHKANSTKLVLQKFRRAGQSDDGSLIVISDYFHAEVEESKQRIVEIKQKLESYHQSIAKPIQLVVMGLNADEKKSDGKAEQIEEKIAKLVEKKERKDQRIKRNLLFLQHNSKTKKGAKPIDIVHNITAILQAEIKEHETRIDTIKGFARRLTPSGS